MDGRNLATTFAASPIHHPIYHQAAVSGAPGPLPTHQQALTTPPPPQGPLVMEMVQQPQGAPVMDVFPTMAALQPPQAGATMGPTMTATQLIQAVEMIARLPVPTAAPDFFDMPSGQQMTGCEQDMAEFNESIELPFVPNIHNETPSIDFYERSLPSNASDTLYVEGLPSNCTIRELTHLFRHFTGFSDLRLVHGGIDNTYLIALVEFNTPIQAFSVMEYLQGYLFDIHDPYSHRLHLQFCPSARHDFWTADDWLSAGNSWI